MSINIAAATHIDIDSGVDAAILSLQDAACAASQAAAIALFAAARIAPDTVSALRRAGLASVVYATFDRPEDAYAFTAQGALSGAAPHGLLVANHYEADVKMLIQPDLLNAMRIAADATVAANAATQQPNIDDDDSPLLYAVTVDVATPAEGGGWRATVDHTGRVHCEAMSAYCEADVQCTAVLGQRPSDEAIHNAIQAALSCAANAANDVPILLLFVDLDELALRANSSGCFAVTNRNQLQVLVAERGDGMRIETLLDRIATCAAAPVKQHLVWLRCESMHCSELIRVSATIAAETKGKRHKKYASKRR